MRPSKLIIIPLFFIWIISANILRGVVIPKFAEEFFFENFDSKLIDSITLGHRSLYDHIISIWLINKLADPKDTETADTLYKRVAWVFKQKTKLESSYLFASFVFGFDKKRPDLSIPILEDGLKELPNSWMIPMTLGFLYAFRLEEPRTAASYYDLAYQRGAPPYARGFSIKLRLKKDYSQEKDQQLKWLFEEFKKTP